MKGHRSKDVYGITEGGKGYCDLKCSLKDEYFAGQIGFWRTYVKLENNGKDSTTKESQLVVRRRRRAHQSEVANEDGQSEGGFEMNQNVAKRLLHPHQTHIL